MASVRASECLGSAWGEFSGVGAIGQHGQEAQSALRTLSSMASAGPASRPMQESMSRSPRPGGPASARLSPAWPAHLGMKETICPDAVGGPWMVRIQGPAGHGPTHPTEARRQGPQPGHPTVERRTAAFELSTPAADTHPHPASGHSTSGHWPDVVGQELSGKKLFLGTIPK